MTDQQLKMLASRQGYRLEIKDNHYTLYLTEKAFKTNMMLFKTTYKDTVLGYLTDTDD